MAIGRRACPSPPPPHHLAHKLHCGWLRRCSLPLLVCPHPSPLLVCPHPSPLLVCSYLSPLYLASVSRPIARLCWCAPISRPFLSPLSLAPVSRPYRSPLLVCSYLSPLSLAVSRPCISSLFLASAGVPLSLASAGASDADIPPAAIHPWHVMPRREGNPSKRSLAFSCPHIKDPSGGYRQHKEVACTYMSSPSPNAPWTAGQIKSSLISQRKMTSTPKQSKSGHPDFSTV